MKPLKNLEIIRNREYGNYSCSCGCGKVLGNPNPDMIEYSIGVAKVADDEGYAWRMFNDDCWERVCKEWDLEVQAEMSSYDYQFTLNQIYEAYPASISVD